MSFRWLTYDYESREENRTETRNTLHMHAAVNLPRCGQQTCVAIFNRQNAEKRRGTVVFVLDDPREQKTAELFHQPLPHLWG